VQQRQLIRRRKRKRERERERKRKPIRSSISFLPCKKVWPATANMFPSISFPLILNSTYFSEKKKRGTVRKTPGF
jgi:hypothetical protein